MRLKILTGSSSFSDLIHLSYNLPSSIAQKLSVQNIRLGFMANNLLTITGFEGYDPEVANIGGGAASRNLQQGWVNIALPQMRSYNFNINLTF